MAALKDRLTCSYFPYHSIPPTDKWVDGKLQPHSSKLFAEGGQRAPK